MYGKRLNFKYRVKDNQRYYPGQVGTCIGEKGSQVFLSFEKGIVVPSYHHEIKLIKVGELDV